MKTRRWIAFYSIALIGLLVVIVGDRNSAPGSGFRQAERPVPKYTEEGSEACLLCHSGEKMQAVVNGPHGARDDESSPLSARGCESCHGPGSFHVSRAHGGKGFPGLLEFGGGANASPDDEQISACQACHAQAVGRTGVIVFTGSPHEDILTCTECHSAHVERDPMRDHEFQVETCFTCHDDMETDHPQIDGETLEFDDFSCSDCHDVHAVAD